MELNIVVPLIVSFVVCECFSQWNQYVKVPALADQICPADLVEFQKVTRTAAECVWRCNGWPDCRSLIYVQGNMTCFGLKSDNPFGVTSSSLPGAVFYKSASQGTPMVAGLPDSQFVASTYLNSWWAPWNVKFNTPSMAWLPITSDQNQFVQVDFAKQVLAMHVQTKGHPDKSNWVTSYKVLTSTDCATFVAFTDDQNRNKIFDGNVDRLTVVTHALTPPVLCRCFRIAPRTWNVVIELQFEVLGRVH